MPFLTCPPAILLQDSPQVQCLRAYKPRENDELALEKADVVMVTQQSNDGERESPRGPGWRVLFLRLLGQSATHWVA